jgi:hypothetical protein
MKIGDVYFEKDYFEKLNVKKFRWDSNSKSLTSKNLDGK